MAAANYAQYWADVFGRRSPIEVVCTFDLVCAGLDEWIGTAEEVAWEAAGRRPPEAHQGELHAMALRDLRAAIAERDA